MNLDFDKEIDAILRNARRDGPVYVGDAVGTRHLDTDEIAAFAENALPEKTRPLYMAHLADCDRCRKILSNLLVMNAETAPVAAIEAHSAITIAERDLPWYRKLLLFPNLAYLMGSLVLIFGGFLAFTVIQNSGLGDSAMISQVPEATETRGGPNFQTEPDFSSGMAANTAANTAAAPAMSNSNSTIASATPSEPGIAGPRTVENNFVTDGLTATESAAPPAPPPSAAAQPVAKEDRGRDDVSMRSRAEEKAAATTSDAAKGEALMKDRNNTIPSQSGPMRNNEAQINRQYENLDRRAAAAKAKRAADRDEDSSAPRTVGGKTFERKQSVWYDTTFQGRPTINVRRGTDEFRRLDAGLKAIANNLPGTIVVVWGAKAYRIQ